MIVTLISPYLDITAFGLRTISSYLRKYGHETHLVDLCGDEPAITQVC